MTTPCSSVGHTSQDDRHRRQPKLATGQHTGLVLASRACLFCAHAMHPWWESRAKPPSLKKAHTSGSTSWQHTVVILASKTAAADDGMAQGDNDSSIVLVMTDDRPRCG